MSRRPKVSENTPKCDEKESMSAVRVNVANAALRIQSAERDLMEMQFRLSNLQTHTRCKADPWDKPCLKTGLQKGHWYKYQILHEPQQMSIDDDLPLDCTNLFIFPGIFDSVAFSTPPIKWSYEKYRGAHLNNRDIRTDMLTADTTQRNFEAWVDFLLDGKPKSEEGVYFHICVTGTGNIWSNLSVVEYKPELDNRDGPVDVKHARLCKTICSECESVHFAGGMHLKFTSPGLRVHKKEERWFVLIDNYSGTFAPCPQRLLKMVEMLRYIFKVPFILVDSHRAYEIERDSTFDSWHPIAQSVRKLTSLTLLSKDAISEISDPTWTPKIPNDYISTIYDGHSD